MIFKLTRFYRTSSNFHKTRKEIEHRYDHNATIDIKMIKGNLDYAMQLLKHIELVTREKRLEISDN